MPKIFIDSLGSAGYLPAMQAGFQWLDLGAHLKPGDHVCIKPNLTFPTFRRGVMTNPECLESLVVALGDYTSKITIVEADSGGYNRFRIDDVFERIGLNELSRRHGVRVLNLSDLPTRSISVQARGQELSVPLPCLLLDECDFFMTVPVPKVHANTVVSLAVKNQWGCIPLPSARLDLHPYFPEVIHAVNQALRTSLAVVDGRFGLTRNGPMLGDVLELNWLMVADDIYAADWTCCQIMQIDPRKPPYLEYLRKAGALPPESSLVFNDDYRKFRRERFYLRRKWTDYPGLIAFHSAAAAYWGYKSPLAGFFHWLLYLFREPFY